MDAKSRSNHTAAIQIPFVLHVFTDHGSAFAVEAFAVDDDNAHIVQARFLIAITTQAQG